MAMDVDALPAGELEAPPAPTPTPPRDGSSSPAGHGAPATPAPRWAPAPSRRTSPAAADSGGGASLRERLLWLGSWPRGLFTDRELLDALARAGIGDVEGLQLAECGSYAKVLMRRPWVARDNTVRFQIGAATYAAKARMAPKNCQLYFQPQALAPGSTSAAAATSEAAAALPSPPPPAESPGLVEVEGGATASVRERSVWLMAHSRAEWEPSRRDVALASRRYGRVEAMQWLRIQGAWAAVVLFRRPEDAARLIQEGALVIDGPLGLCTGDAAEYNRTRDPWFELEEHAGMDEIEAEWRRLAAEGPRWLFAAAPPVGAGAGAAAGERSSDAAGGNVGPRDLLNRPAEGPALAAAAARARDDAEEFFGARRRPRARLRRSSSRDRKRSRRSRSRSHSRSRSRGVRVPQTQSGAGSPGCGPVPRVSSPVTPDRGASSPAREAAAAPVSPLGSPLLLPEASATCPVEVEPVLSPLAMGQGAQPWDEPPRAVSPLPEFEAAGASSGAQPSASAPSQRRELQETLLAVLGKARALLAEPGAPSAPLAADREPPASATAPLQAELEAVEGERWPWEARTLVEAVALAAELAERLQEARAAAARAEQEAAAARREEEAARQRADALRAQAASNAMQQEQEMVPLEKYENVKRAYFEAAEERGRLEARLRELGHAP
eukprot:tig00000383_g24627.t1